MRKGRYSDEQVIAILREQEAGTADGGDLPQVRRLERDLLQMEIEVRRACRCPTPSA